MTSHLINSHIVRTVTFAGALTVAAIAAPLTADAEMPDAYTWSAELVAFDEATKTATVQAMIVSHSEIEDFESFSKGDQILLTWSGAYSSASGVRNLRHEASVDEGELFAMPVEFVSFEMDNRYVRFNVPVPASDLATIKNLEPGKWITATTPHEPVDLAEAVTTIRPYNA